MYISPAESESLAYCDRESLYYILPAVFTVAKPYPLYNRYNFCPPDVLHTVLGGYLKDWIFNVCVIVTELKSLSPRYKNNLSTFNGLVKQFPVSQGAGYSLKKFYEGFTPYVVNKKDKKSMSKTRISKTYTFLT